MGGESVNMGKSGSDYILGTRKCVFLTCRGTSSILQDLLCYCIEKGEQRKKESQHRFIFYYVFIPLDYFVTCSYYLSGHSKKGRS